ncbi:aldose 1-epimerase [Lentibacillus kapialis]|uniref:Aldose 1-epimerase n=1 Tax=Lentibacillus kapialis TaxID=340214 RepID=A0A917V0T8_9BACI|nr:aldose epimerase family protein [Lentibacillus kapialis]GGK05158.1 aldose 1-epimerase [Lentibacillus kapialis]
MLKITTKNIQSKWTEFTLTNDHDMSVSILNFGGIITNMMVPDQHGNTENIVLGYNNYADYEKNANYIGAQVGRVAGRIKDGRFYLNGSRYELAKNEGRHHLHGGPNGLHQVIWEADTYQSEHEVSLVLTHTSKHFDNGYPGNLELAITYSLNNTNELTLDYRGKSDQDTPVALTNHTYFNLSGNMKNTVHDHQVQFDSHYVAELDEELMPTGHLIEPIDTPFDFRNGRLLGKGLKPETAQQKIAGNGYDHYFMFGNERAVTVSESNTERTMKIHTSEPGMVLYTANGLDEGLKLNEGLSQKYAGVCFEAQAHPAALHHEGFPNVIVEAGETYRSYITYSF